MGYRFVWDPRKAESNARKHGVTFEEASTVFGDPLALLKPDPDHSKRRRAILVTWYVNAAAAHRRGVPEMGTQTRLISARAATRREKRQYEEEI